MVHFATTVHFKRLPCVPPTYDVFHTIVVNYTQLQCWLISEPLESMKVNYLLTLLLNDLQVLEKPLLFRASRQYLLPPPIAFPISFPPPPPSLSSLHSSYSSSPSPPLLWNKNFDGEESIYNTITRAGRKLCTTLEGTRQTYFSVMSAAETAHIPVCILAEAYKYICTNWKL